MKSGGNGRTRCGHKQILWEFFKISLYQIDGMCVYIYFFTIGIYSLYICHVCMCMFLYTYSSKAHKTKLNGFEIQT